MGTNRPIVVATFGYVIGIIWGLYFNINIVFIFIYIALILMVIKFIQKFKNKEKTKGKFKFFSINKIFRYIKLILNSKTIIIIIIFASISNNIIKILNNKYENLYFNIDETSIIARIIDNGSEKEYKKVYKIKVETINNDSKYEKSNLYLSINKNLEIDLEYGDKIQISGNFIKPERARNYQGFNYFQYLKTLKIYGTVNADKITLISKNNNNLLFTISNNILLKIQEVVKENMNEADANLLLGILLGYKNEISEEIQEDFKQSNISHILAVSGLHVSYIMMAAITTTQKMYGKKISKIICIILIISYMFITNFSPSVVRAGIMAIMIMMSKLSHNKNDIWTSIAISILILLIYNPYLITTAGVLLSYGGTIGIIILQKTINKLLIKIRVKSKLYKYKSNKKVIAITEYIEDTLSVSFSAQIVIAPIMARIFNTLSLSFFITNFFISLIIGPIVVIGFLLIILVCLKQYCIKISILNLVVQFIFKIIKFLTEKLLIILISISKLGNIIPLSKIYVITPTIWQIVIFYLAVLFINFMFKILSKKALSTFERRIINLKNLIKHRIRKNKTLIIKAFLCICIISIVFFIANYEMYGKQLKIYFIDVGQGDSTLIITPKGKTILIDGGGSENYDVGKNTLLPYLLDRRIKKIDYVVVSHTDSDHIRTEY